MTKGKEYYSNMSAEMRSWKSTLNSLDKKIKRLEHKLAPYLEEHFEGRIYINSMQTKINSFNKLKEDYKTLKSNRPEPKKSTAPKLRGKIVKSYTEDELLIRYTKLSKDNKILVLHNALENMSSYNGRTKITCIFMGMGYELNEETDKWEKR